MYFLLYVLKYLNDSKSDMRPPPGPPVHFSDPPVHFFKPLVQWDLKYFV